MINEVRDAITEQESHTFVAVNHKQITDASYVEAGVFDEVHFNSKSYSVYFIGDLQTVGVSGHGKHKMVEITSELAEELEYPYLCDEGVLAICGTGCNKDEKIKSSISHWIDIPGAKLNVQFM